MKMTDFSNAKVKVRSDKTKKITASILILSLSALICGFMSPFITKFTVDGLKLCANTVIGSVFPFLILTDVIVKFANFEAIGWLRSIFEKIFKINGYAITAYFIGLLCGFPLGVKVSVDLYKSGFISKDECERLIGFSNNTGPAFIIAGVGFGLRGSIKDGVILYFSMLISSLLSGFIMGIGKRSTAGERVRANDEGYDFTSSVKTAATNTLNICAFVVFFSVISGILSILIKCEAIYVLIISILEVSNATKTLARDIQPRLISMALSSFAISFSGISVHMQAKCFLSGTDLSMRRYYVTKILQGIISAVICSFIVLILK